MPNLLESFRNWCIRVIPVVFTDFKTKTVRPEVAMRVRRCKLLRQIEAMETTSDLSKVDDAIEVFYDDYSRQPQILHMLNEFKVAKDKRRDSIKNDIVNQLSRVQ